MGEGGGWEESGRSFSALVETPAHMKDAGVLCAGEKVLAQHGIACSSVVHGSNNAIVALKRSAAQNHGFGIPFALLASLWTRQ